MNRYTARTALLEAIMVLATAVIAMPLYLLVNISLKGDHDTSSPLAPATSPTFENYRNAWHHAGLGSAMWNSFQVDHARCITRHQLIQRRCQAPQITSGIRLGRVFPLLRRHEVQCPQYGTCQREGRVGRLILR